MANTTTSICLPPLPSLEMAWRDVDSSFERFCLTAGIGAIGQMLCEDAQQLTGAPHRRGGGRVGHRWGTTAGKIGFHAALAHRQEALRSKVKHENATTWLTPKLVCEVKFTERTSGGEMRHPFFLGLRADKEALDVIREQP